MTTDDLREKSPYPCTSYSKELDDDIWTDDYVLWLEYQLIKQDSKNNQAKLKFNEFANKQQDLDSEFVKIVNDNFWDLI